MEGTSAGRRGGKQGGIGVLAERAPVVRVLLGDGDPLAAQAIGALLSAEAGVAVIGCETGVVGLTYAVETVSPSVLVVDVGQRQFSGPKLLSQWIAACRHVVVLSTDLTPEDVVEFLRVGVRGVVDKADAALLGVAVRAAAAGQVFVAPAVSTPLVDRWRAMDTLPSTPLVVAALPVAPEVIPPGGPLTHQERTVLVLLAAGHTSVETARQLGVSAGTMQGHLHRVLDKLNAKDRTQAVAWAYLSGLCPVSDRPLIPYQRAAP